VIIAYTILRELEDQVVMPVVVGRAVDLHPVVTIFAVLAGGAIAGVLGMLLAVPTAFGAQRRHQGGARYSIPLRPRRSPRPDPPRHQESRTGGRDRRQRTQSGGAGTGRLMGNGRET